MMSTPGERQARAMGRREAEDVFLHVEWLLGYAHVLPGGLAGALRAYRADLLSWCAAQPWAAPGHQARYAALANALHDEIAAGLWGPGARLPLPAGMRAGRHESMPTTHSALFVLAVRGVVARERGGYYVLPPGPDPGQASTGRMTRPSAGRP
jgi:hypothetical protein